MSASASTALPVGAAPVLPRPRCGAEATTASERPRSLQLRRLPMPLTLRAAVALGAAVAAAPSGASADSTPVLAEVAEAPFDPNSRMVSYKDVNGCGPRGADARAELLRACQAGHYVVKHSEEAVTIAGCAFKEYTVYACNPLPQVPPFDPSSPMVSYKDVNTCGPRGEDAEADLRGCPYGAHVVRVGAPPRQASAESKPTEKYDEANSFLKVVATIDYCDYYNYSVYACNDPPEAPYFFPASPLVSYKDMGGCGARSKASAAAEGGTDAAAADVTVEAQTSICSEGSRMLAQRAAGSDGKPVAIVAGCRYSAYTAYECIYSQPPPFEPASPLVEYLDVGGCGPRGANAKAELSRSCPFGAHVVKSVPWHKRSVVAKINGCEYHAYRVYECDKVPEQLPFDPMSPLVAYGDVGGCGPRGPRAEVDARTCPNGVHVVKDVPDIGRRVVATINYCEYYRYRVYACNDLPDLPPFDPANLHVAYHSAGNCGPRGETAVQDTSNCKEGARLLERRGSSSADVKYVVATVDDCDYYEYAIYKCNGQCPKHYYDCDQYCAWSRDCSLQCVCEEADCPQGCVVWKTVETDRVAGGAGGSYVPSFGTLAAVVLLVVGCLTLKALLGPKPVGAPLLDDAEEMPAVQFNSIGHGQARQLQSAGFSQF
eukprot:TRINITY_DN25694_c0_g2_i1.p1 TRINITY_DN25694_c0_g2~~TRINITY_DN25694_c0_g2_i1.p1  ORF type:complete len:657 (+),score=105.79 TRINITY_DN25694_c0_g2_i1:68-2038(+)